MKTYLKKFATFSQDFRNVHREAKKQGFCQYYETSMEGPFVGRTAFQWVYLPPSFLVFPSFLEWTNHTGQHDWLGLFALGQALSASSWLPKGVLVTTFWSSEFRIYLVLALNKNFYGEVLTTLYFFIMQPIGLCVWLSNRINDQGKVEESHFEAKKLNLIEWMRYLALCAVIWIGMGFAYQYP